MARLFCQIDRAGWEKLAETADFQLRPLAALCGAPLWLLERLFKRRFRRSPVAWMRRLKCRRATEAIRAGAYLKELFPGLGFASPSDFCKQFTKAFGVSSRRFALGRQRGGGGG